MSAVDVLAFLPAATLARVAPDAVLVWSPSGTVDISAKYLDIQVQRFAQAVIA